jgi:hypothetical protein
MIGSALSGGFEVIEALAGNTVCDDRARRPEGRSEPPADARTDPHARARLALGSHGIIAR